MIVYNYEQKKNFTLNYNSVIITIYSMGPQTFRVRRTFFIFHRMSRAA